MEGPKKKHFPSIQRNLESGRHPDVIKSLLRFKDENLALATTSDLTGAGSTGDFTTASAEVRHRRLRKKKSEALQSMMLDSSNLKTATTVSSIAKIGLEEETAIQQIEYIMSQDGTRSVMQQHRLSDSEARCAIFDGIFLGSLLRTASSSDNRQQMLTSMIYERLRRHGSMVALRLSCEDKENRINDLIENRLKKLAASLLQ